MSSPRYENLTNSVDRLSQLFPDRLDVVERVANMVSKWQVEQASSTGKRKELSLTRIFDEVEPSSISELARILSILVEGGVLEKVIRVESPALGGIDDFQSLSDIPPVIFDPFTGSDLQITPSNLKTIFRLNPA